LLLQVLVGSEGDQAADENDSVEPDAHAGGARLGSGRDGTQRWSLGRRVARLVAARCVSKNGGCLLGSSRESRGLGISQASYLALQCADLELGQCFPGLVAVADILESLGGVLASHV